MRRDSRVVVFLETRARELLPIRATATRCLPDKENRVTLHEYLCKIARENECQHDYHEAAKEGLRRVACGDFGTEVPHRDLGNIIFEVTESRGIVGKVWDGTQPFIYHDHARSSPATILNFYVHWEPTKPAAVSIVETGGGEFKDVEVPAEQWPKIVRQLAAIRTV